MFQAGASPRLLLKPEWSNRFRSVWSVPLGGGAVQFAFKKDYAWLPREVHLITSATLRAKSVLERLSLTAQLAQREQEVRQLARRMLDTEERERRRIRRELHDETAQILPYLRLRLETLERAAPQAATGLKRDLAEARELIERTIIEIRRILSDLSPAVLEQLGLAAAVRQLLNQVRRTNGMAVSLDSRALRRLPHETETAAYRIIQECCTNVARHSAATHLKISLCTADRELKVRIEDDGVGFSVQEALTKKDSYGLAGMQERAALAGGRFDVSSRPGRGTRVAVSLPAPRPSARSSSFQPL
jgi:signal transduction histidine kinase